MNTTYRNGQKNAHIRKGADDEQYYQYHLDRNGSSLDDEKNENIGLSDCICLGSFGEDENCPYCYPIKRI